MFRLSLLCGVLTATLLCAQDPELRVSGGSLGGTIDLELEGSQFGQTGAIFLSLTPGPTPLALLDPTDPRVLSVGLDLLGLTLVGPMLSPPVFAPPSFQIPNQPALVDGALFFQGVTLFGPNGRLIDGVSLPRAVRFAPPNAFRDRFRTLTFPRSFFPVIDGDDGRVLVVGGGQGALFAQIATEKTEWFDPISDGFSAGPDMTSPRSLHTATQLLDGRWLIVGGVDRNNDPVTAVEIFDPSNGTFTAVASMALQRMGHTATRLLDGRVLVSGGLTDLNAPNTQIDPVYSITRTTEIYDPVTDTWNSGPQLRQPRAGHVAIPRADGRVLLAGGVSWFTFIVRLPSIENSTDLFDPSTNGIVAGPNLRQSRGLPSLIQVSPGRWLLAGGVGTISLTQWGTLTTAAEIYDEAANTFTARAPMAQARGLHQAFDLGGGRILQIGGGDGTLFAITPLATCEVYDVAANVWSAGPPLNLARVAYGAYTTATGQLHVLGGDTPSGVDFSTEFLYR
jgi:hypothetical protein